MCRRIKDDRITVWCTKKSTFCFQKPFHQISEAWGAIAAAPIDCLGGQNRANRISEKKWKGFLQAHFCWSCKSWQVRGMLHPILNPAKYSNRKRSLLCLSSKFPFQQFAELQLHKFWSTSILTVRKSPLWRRCFRLQASYILEAFDILQAGIIKKPLMAICTLLACRSSVLSQKLQVQSSTIYRQTFLLSVNNE